MKRSGSSSSCLLRSNYCETNKDHPDEPGSSSRSVTLINTQSLPMYNTDRFYMLSELEFKLHSTSFLCDYLDTHIVTDMDDSSSTQATIESSESYDEASPPTAASTSTITANPSSVSSTNNFYSILYLVWWKSGHHQAINDSVSRFIQDVIMTAMNQSKKFLELNGDGSANNNRYFYYLVVDIVASASTTVAADDSTTTTTKEESENMASDNNENSTRQQQEGEHQFQQVMTMNRILAEQLARQVAVCPELRCALDGIIVGISNQIRAAPGLEACLDAVSSIGSKEQRLLNTSSQVRLVTYDPQDLFGVMPPQTAAATNTTTNTTPIQPQEGVLLQSRTCAEWNGNGNLFTFCQRAHVDWCNQHDIMVLRPNKTDTRKRKRRRNIALNVWDDDDYDLHTIHPTLWWFMAIVCLGWIASRMWDQKWCGITEP